MNKTLNTTGNLEIVLGVSRIPFLLLSPAVLLPVWGYAVYQTGEWQLSLLALVLLVAVTAHVAVNALNEYQDFRSGLDLNTEKTPFSGGSGTLPANPEAESIALWVTLVSLGACVAGGLILIGRYGTALILPGLVGVGLILSYTRWLNRIPLLCLLAPGIGFGLVMGNGAGLVFLGGHSAGVASLSLMATCLCSSLLLLNQFPDIEADRAAGRRHVLIQYGLQKGVALFIGLVLLAYLVLVVAVVMDFLPFAAIAGLLTVPLSVSVVDHLRKATRNSFRVDGSFIQAMGKNVAVTLLTPVASGAGILLMSFRG